MEISFEIDLGKGWFMDSTGRLHQDVVPRVPVYELEGGLPFNPEKVKEVLSAIKSAMPPDMDEKDYKDSDAIKMWKKFGLSDATIKLLSKLGVVASALSIYIAIIVALFEVAKAMGVFSEGPDKLEQKLDEVKEELKAFSKADTLRYLINSLDDIKSKLDPLLSQMKSFTNELTSDNPNPDQIKALSQAMYQVQIDAAEAAIKATSSGTYLLPFDAGEYHWQYIPGKLVLQPEGALEPVPFVPYSQGTLRCDHRIAVPFSLYASEAYLSIIKGIMPEYRTTGEYTDTLRTLAKNIYTITANMRAIALSRIVYSPLDFELIPHWGFVPNHPAFYTFSTGEPPLPGGKSEGPTYSSVTLDNDPISYVTLWNYTVGAVDLIAYNDIFLLKTSVNDEERNAAISGTGTVKRGQLEMLWTPMEAPLLNTYIAPTTGKFIPGYTQPDLCAKWANELSEKAYLELLASSGYLQLVHQAALLNHLSTEPDKSETVEGTASFARIFERQEAVTAQSRDFAYSPTFTTPAIKNSQRFRAQVKITTQPLGRPATINYKIWLRTLKMEADGKKVFDIDYNSAYLTYYTNDEANHGFKKLVTEFRDYQVRDEILLVQSYTPSDPINKEESSSIKADTFDWYKAGSWVEKNDEPTDLGWVHKKGELTNLGWREDFARKKYTGVEKITKTNVGEGENNTVNEMSSTEWKFAGWQTTKTDLAGERRNLLEEEISVGWKLQWEKDHLFITVEGRPQDRNCLLFIVVEEELKSSKQFLHTSFALPIFNQITIVPKDFFEREEKTFQRDLKIISEVSQPNNWSEPGGGIPSFITDGLHIREFLNQYGMQELVRRLNDAAPQLVENIVSKYS